jgi:ABC-type multidrug transport system ATPase subunit
LISDHNVRETLGACDLAFILSDGKVIETGTPEQIASSPSPGESTWETNSNSKMAIELRQQLKLTQQLIMTPQLQMAIKLLQLSRLELVDTIRQELEENPTLEEIQETPDKAKESESEEAPAAVEENREVTIDEKINDEIDWSNYIDEYNSPGKVNFESESREAPNTRRSSPPRSRSAITCCGSC